MSNPWIKVILLVIFGVVLGLSGLPPSTWHPYVLVLIAGLLAGIP